MRAETFRTPARPFFRCGPRNFAAAGLPWEQLWTRQLPARPLPAGCSGTPALRAVSRKFRGFVKSSGIMGRAGRVVIAGSPLPRVSSHGDRPECRGADPCSRHLGLVTSGHSTRSVQLCVACSAYRRDEVQAYSEVCRGSHLDSVRAM